MKIKILSERENPLLERQEIKFEVTFTGGVKSIREIRKEIISTLKSKEELTILNGLKTKFGEKQAEGYVKVYKNKKALEVEPKFRLEKNFKEGRKESPTGGEVEEPKKPGKEEKEERPESQEKEVKREVKKLEEPTRGKEEGKETTKPVKEKEIEKKKSR